MVRINLLPIRVLLRKRELKQFAFLAGGILAVTIAVMGVAYLGFSMKISGLQEKEKALKNKLADLKKQNEEINKLKDEIARLQKQVNTIENLTKKRDSPAPFMRALTLTIPDEVWVKALSKSGKTFSLSGSGLDNTVVVRFVQNLQELKKEFTAKDWRAREKADEHFFSNVKLVQIIKKSAKGESGMDFKIVGNLQ